jgi:LuxR family maltose regulon positive regulatory protein
MELPEHELKSRASAWSTLYRAYGMDGQIEAATQAYKECFRLAQAAGEYGMLGNTTMIRAFDLCQYGRLDEAAQYCRSVIDAGERSHQQVFLPAGPCYIGLAGVHLERYELDSAEELLQKGMAACRQGAPVGLYTGSVQTVRLLQAQGDLEGAWSRLTMLEQTFQRRDFTVTERQVSLRLAMGDVDGAARLAPSILELFGDSPYAQVMPLIAAEAFKLTLARIFVAQGALERAETVLDEIAATVGPGKRYGRLMEVFLVRALAALARADGESSPQAVVYLASALELAERYGMVLLLLEAGPRLVPLLGTYIAGSTRADRSATHALLLLDALGVHDTISTSYSSSASSVLVEPLTKREMEVLVLVAAGGSNQEIADELVITVRTVKKHVTNILAKLGATNRTQAVARARELDVLTAA